MTALGMGRPTRVLSRVVSIIVEVSAGPTMRWHSIEPRIVHKFIDVAITIE